MTNFEIKILKLAEELGEVNSQKIIKPKNAEELNLADIVSRTTKYKYMGKPAQRDFCKKMLRLNKLYTKQEINLMSTQGVNRKFGHKRRNYSIFSYKGGINCNHYWYEVEERIDSKGKKTIVGVGRAEGKAGQIANSSNNFWRHPSNK